MQKSPKIGLKFRKEITAFMESGKKKEVYKMNIQLIPMTRAITKDNK